MPTITDAASEIMIRLDMTNPFLRLVIRLSLRKSQRADYAKTVMARDSSSDVFPLSFDSPLSFDPLGVKKFTTQRTRGR
jgi:hypothetical protein